MLVVPVVVHFGWYDIPRTAQAILVPHMQPPSHEGGDPTRPEQDPAREDGPSGPHRSEQPDEHDRREAVCEDESRAEGERGTEEREGAEPEGREEEEGKHLGVGWQAGGEDGRAGEGSGQREGGRKGCATCEIRYSAGCRFPRCC